MRTILTLRVELPDGYPIESLIDRQDIEAFAERMQDQPGETFNHMISLCPVKGPEITVMEIDHQ